MSGRGGTYEGPDGELLYGDGKEVDASREAPSKMKFSDFLLDLDIGKKGFTWGLQEESARMNALIDRFGEESDKWPGKKLKLMLSKETGVNGQKFIRIV